MTRTLLAAMALVAVASSAWAEPATLTDRRRMVEDIKTMTSEVAGETGIASLSARVLDRMAEVPRHEFVPSEQKAAAYRNRPLALGHGQTISQPFVVALMTELLDVKKEHRVLEIGTGSGYQAAVLAGLVRDVYTIEIVGPLAETAAAAFERLGYTNIHATVGDGYRGWPEHGPYDGIVVTAAPDHIPPALIEQLKPGGRLVIPVGEIWQDLMVLTKNADGTTTRTTVVPVRFVPLTRKKNEDD
ncbi:protein-L-isoaspartate(D-aspartate) O-methyltransferase [Hyphomicrobium nitrativorans]|uniref:protein-L-isoaspartate(D-aspartate) O-methyltransferase n=1 Tax=Hyphomicrobium nitrativorans TaxID=1427356 RepID=UPI001FCCBD78|nr:protein-L-isoaspartate(D-aspartate) O-methyltransferase [Hyphomicrobium nitrativorans]